VTGELQRITRTGGFNGNPSISPDGRFAAFRSNRTGNTELWCKDLRAGKEIQLTNTPGNEDRPALSPDGTRVAYSFPEGKNWLLSVEGGSPELLCENCGEARGWFPDNRRIVLNLAPRTDHSTIGSYDLATRKIQTIIEHPKSAVSRARISPDGSWMAFELAPSTNTRQVFIAPLRERPPNESEWIAVTDGKALENKPEWSLNGRYVYYFSDRDGFGCVWARAFDPHKHAVTGEAIGVLHMHTSEKTMLSLDGIFFDISVAKDKLLFNASKVTANIHALKLP
jgi:eukaryotic-like serine/threonine-protein kinase